MRKSTILSDRRASAALEFALVMPVFLLFLLGMLEYGRMVWTWQALQATAGVTARCVAIGSSDCPIAATYANAVAGRFGIGNPTITASHALGACNAPSVTDMESVTLQLPFPSPVGKVLPGLRGTLTASACYPVATT